MDYEIKRLRGGDTVSVELTDGLPFATIKQDAENWIEQGLADRVEVRDATGKLVHHHPRVMRPAP